MKKRPYPGKFTFWSILPYMSEYCNISHIPLLYKYILQTDEIGVGLFFGSQKVWYFYFSMSLSRSKIMAIFFASVPSKMPTSRFVWDRLWRFGPKIALFVIWPYDLQMKIRGHFLCFNFYYTEGAFIHMKSKEFKQNLVVLITVSSQEANIRLGWAVTKIDLLYNFILSWGSFL